MGGGGEVPILSHGKNIQMKPPRVLPKRKRNERKSTMHATFTHFYPADQIGEREGLRGVHA